jgi:hypothetical protein
MSESAMMQLHLFKQKVDLSKVGLLSGVHPVINETELRVLRDNMAQYGVAHALMVKGIGTGIEASLVVRPVIPSEDLRKGSTGTAIISTEWRQPADSGEYATADGSEGNQEVIYTTSKDSKNDQRILLFYGAKYVGGGNFRTAACMRSTMIIFYRGTVKTIDKWHTQGLNTAENSYLAAMTPVMYKINDVARIAFVPNASVPTGSGNKFDSLELLGITVEAIGVTVMG